MPIPSLPAFDGAEPAQRLEGFWWWVQDTLDTLQGEEYRHLFVPQLVAPMRAAWQEARPRFEVAQPFLARLRRIRYGSTGYTARNSISNSRRWDSGRNGSLTRVRQQFCAGS